MTTTTSLAPAATSVTNRMALTGVAFAGLFIGGLTLPIAMGSGTFPSPFEADAVTEAYFAGNQGAILGMGIVHALSAVLLFAFVGVITRGTRARLARTGGLLAAASLAASGLLTIAIPVLDATGDTLHDLHYQTFLAGGPAHVALLGLFVGAATIAFARSAPKWITVLGAVSACLSLLSLASILTESAMILLPMGRFTGIIWIVIMAVRAARRT